MTEPGTAERLADRFPTLAALMAPVLGLFYVVALPLVGIPALLLYAATGGRRREPAAGDESTGPLEGEGERNDGAHGAERPRPLSGVLRGALAPLVERLGCEYLVVDRDFVIVEHLRPGRDGPAAEVDESLGQRCHEVHHGSTSPCSACGGECPAEAAWASEEEVRATHSHVMQDDEQAGERLVEVVATPIRDEEGAITHVGLLVRDADS